MAAIPDDATQVANTMVEEPPYRMVPGNDSVCSRDVLRRFHSSPVRMQPSKTQQRKKGYRFTRSNVSGFIIADIIERKTGYPRVSSTGGHGILKASEHHGQHITYISRIQEVHVRWNGDLSTEEDTLSGWQEILRQAGYSVVIAEENNVDWPVGQARSWIQSRRNRKFLRVARFHSQRKT